MALRSASSLVPLLLVAAACGDSGPDCEGSNGACIVVSPSDDDHAAIQAALIDARPGDVIFVEAGTYEVRRGLSLDVDDVTIRGEGIDRTILSFAGQVDGAQGLLATGDDFAIEDLTVQDTVGDGIKVEGATGVSFRRVRAEWTADPGPDNGAYGLYPVQCTDVLIEDSEARGASDAGIYVGQSQNIIVRRNRAERNVAGIEIENSIGADVYQNTATENTGGLLVFNLPGLQVKNGSRTRVFDNDVFANNWPNFAPEGNIVGKVPQGTGLVSIAAHEVEVFENRVSDHQTVNSAAISFLTTMVDYDDPEYDPYTDSIYFHDNVYVGDSTQPSGDMGLLLAGAIGSVRDPLIIPDIVFDGYADPAKSEAGVLLPEFAFCIQDNGDADFGNLDAANGFAGVSLDAAPHDCAHDPLPAIVIAGVE